MIPLRRQASRTILAITILLALAIRIGWALHQRSDDAAIDQLPDQREYLELGRNLQSGQGLWFPDPRFEQNVYAYRTPGYPALIAVCGGSSRIVRIAQAVLDASSVLAIYLLARRWLSGWPALAAAGLVAFNPYLIFFSGLVLSETLFTAMLCWGMVLLVLSGGPWPIQRSRWIAWLGGGVLLALSALVRPGAAGLPILLGIMAALANRFDPTPRRARWPLPIIATMLVLTGIVLFPWAARNRWTLGSWIWTTTNTGITFYDGFNPDATGASNQKFVSQMPWTREMTEVSRSRYFTDLADDWIAQHPADAWRLALVKIGRTWSPVPLSNEYGSRALYVIVGLTYGAVLDILILAGLRWGSLPRSVKGLLLMPALYLTVGAALSVGSLRYRVPAEAPMAILAASALAPGRRHSSA